MKYRVRFHLLSGKHYMHWQVRSVTDNDQLIGRSKDAMYFDPSEFQIEMFGCKLVNQTTIARRVNKSGKKKVCGYVLCDNFDVYRCGELSTKHLERLSYNPIKDVHWRRTGDDKIWDNSTYDCLITDNDRVYILEENSCFEENTIRKTYSVRFNSHFMQKQYENLIRDGHHWKTAEKLTVKQWSENGY